MNVDLHSRKSLAHVSEVTERRRGSNHDVEFGGVVLIRKRIETAFQVRLAADRDYAYRYGRRLRIDTLVILSGGCCAHRAVWCVQRSAPLRSRLAICCRSRTGSSRGRRQTLPPTIARDI